jgi:hypothetical protein
MKAGRFLTAAMLVFALVVVPMAYVGGYYGLPTHTSTGLGSFGGNPAVWRVYRHRWQVTVFEPAARVDSWVTGNEVGLHCVDDLPQ